MRTKMPRIKSNLLSVDIGSHSLKIVAGQYNGGKLKITAMTKVAIEEGVVTNGRIVDAIAFKNHLMHALKEEKIRQKEVVITCEGQDIIKRELIVQKVEAADQMELITYEVGQYLPIDIDAYVLQYKILEEFEEDGVQKIKILLGAMPRDMVKELFDIITECGLVPTYLDMHSNSLDKFINFSLDSIMLNKTIAFVDFGHQLIDISLFEKGQFKFNRLLRLGSNEIDQILKNHFNIDAMEAENRKKKTSVISIIDAVSKEGFHVTDEKGAILKETANYINDCTEEIEKVFKYFTSRSAENKIDQIYLYGGSAQMKDFGSYFKERFEIPTEIITYFKAIEIATKNNVEELPIYVNAVGALIRQ